MADLTVRQQACMDCIESLRPENPTVPQYDRHTKTMLKPLCYYCNNSIGGQPDIFDNGIEGRLTFLEEQEYGHPAAINKDHHELQQLKAQMLNLQKNISIINSNVNIISKRIRDNEYKSTLYKDKYTNRDKGKRDFKYK